MAKKKTPEEGKGGYVVTKPFRDINNYDKVYDIGEDVSHFDEDRILSLIARELVVESSNSTQTPE